ncbi:purine-binding chemotaxis protein CheW [Alicyclobacillus mali]|uniref:Purine-binding chemotaxis protein CheW n=2 Tax=Alicyclobacillus mali (ex Roth et al. 2021) TaxID=1123961 RepID=A0ABS0F1P7_9BACL|nr:chemotaxis protein CheW [Alicyclobacillus mali (ex Roth et al. 2021)]MBF8377220.1 purine-binding chemotaxis protein CheW [Alicyclobacillus mali (ex Roth et al. 2021)]MCL6488131.1 chemotaxis protein CheW [Alicyclobacillus mali (ex Roth et al. 2021)]
MRVGSERYAAHVAQVRSVERVGDITPVPRTLPFIKGVMHLRGAIVPVIDLAERVGLTRAADGDEEDRRIVVAEVDEMAVGMLVDAVEDVVSIAPEAIEPPPSVVGGLEAVYLRGVARWGEHLLVLLNLERVFSAVETEQLRQVEKLVHG